MFFLIGISSVLFIIKFCHGIKDVMSKAICHNAIMDIGTKLFLYYTKVDTNISELYAFYYDNNVFFRHSVNYMQIGYNTIISNIYDYKIEPVDVNWLNIVMTFCCNNDSPQKIVPKMIENYEVVYNHKNKEITDMVFHRKMLYFNHPDDTTVSSTNPMIMYLMKYHDKYLCKHDCHGIYQQWCSEMKIVSNPFFEIEYVDKTNDITHSIDLPRSFFVENNELLSIAFLKRWFEYTYTDNTFVFNDDYVVNITDDSFETISLTKNEYILIGSAGYSIQKIK